MSAPLSGASGIGEFVGAAGAPYLPPSLNLPPQQFQGRGTCTIDSPAGTVQLRTNPNSILWDYSLITHVDQTYGGRVVQILGVKMDNLTIKVDCGQGGWQYAMYIVQYMRDLMVTQRSGISANFHYTTRNWHLKVYALDVPFQDEVPATIRELTLNFKIQEDISGAQTASSLAQGLNLLQDGIGFTQNQFNNFAAGTGGVNNYAFKDFAYSNANGGGMATTLQNTPDVIPASPTTGPPNLGLPGQTDITSMFNSMP